MSKPKKHAVKESPYKTIDALIEAAIDGQDIYVVREVLLSNLHAVTVAWGEGCDTFDVEHWGTSHYSFRKVSKQSGEATQ